MSAHFKYIVNKKTIDKIVTHIYQQLETVKSYYPAIYQASQENGNGGLQPVNPQKLGQRLWAMNVKAVNTRYNERNPVELYRFDSCVSRPIQTYKSLQCYLYQCLEGDVPQLPLYQGLQQISTDMANTIISNLSEYEEADWG